MSMIYLNRLRTDSSVIIISTNQIYVSHASQIYGFFGAKREPVNNEYTAWQSLFSQTYRPISVYNRFLSEIVKCKLHYNFR